MTAVDQCSRCDAVDECVAGNITTLEDVAGVIGCPTPSLHVHLVQHDRDDLLRRLTYNGEPILPPPPLPEPVVEVEVVDEETSDRIRAVYTADMEPAEDRGVQPPEPAIDGGVERQQHGGWPDQPATYYLSEPAAMVLQDLSENHPSEDVRRAVASLLVAIVEWEQDLEARTRLEQLVAQRDQLNAEIEELAARLGDVEPEPEIPKSPVTPRGLLPEGVTVLDCVEESPKAIRAWCRENGVHCPATGRVPRAAVEAYREAHGVA